MEKVQLDVLGKLPLLLIDLEADGLVEPVRLIVGEAVVDCVLVGVLVWEADDVCDRESVWERDGDREKDGAEVLVLELVALEVDDVWERVGKIESCVFVDDPEKVVL